MEQEHRVGLMVTTRPPVEIAYLRWGAAGPETCRPKNSGSTGNEALWIGGHVQASGAQVPGAA